MSVYRPKGSPYYQFDFVKRGLRFSGSTECTDERDAKAVEETKKAEAQQLIDGMVKAGREPMTFGRACDRWWNEHGIHLNDPGRKSVLDWLVAQIGGKKQLHAIIDDDVSRMVEARRKCVVKAGRDGGTQLYRPITPSTVNHTITLMRRVMRRARENWNAMLFREPVWKNHYLTTIKRPVREITQSEEGRLDDIECPDFAAIRRIGIITGLRRKNLILTWPQVDFELAVIRVLTKGGKWRVIPMTKEVYAILWARRGQHRDFVFTFVAQRTRKCPKTDREFVKGTRYPITYYGLGSNKRKWKKVGVAARIHDWRHTTGMRTLRKTRNLKLVQKLLGHKDIKITAEFYTDADLDDIRDGMEETHARPALPAKKAKRKKEDS